MKIYLDHASYPIINFSLQTSFILNEVVGLPSVVTSTIGRPKYVMNMVDV